MRTLAGLLCTLPFAALAADGLQGRSGDELAATPGTLGDPVRAAGWEPGARELLSGLSPLGFDGLQPAASQLTLDGAPVRLPAHAFFGPWAVAPWLVESVRVTPGVTGANRGRFLSRGIELEVPEVALGAGVAARADLLSLGGAASYGFESGASLLLGGRLFTGGLLAQRFVSGLRAELWDAHARAELPVGKGTVRALWLSSGDEVGISFGGLPVALGQSGHTLDVAWRGGEELRGEVGLSLGWLAVGLGTSGQQTQTRLDAREAQVGVRARGEGAVNDALTLRVGGDAELRQVDLREEWTTALEGGGTSRAQDVPPTANTVLAGAFVELLLEESESVAWTLGLRGDFWAPASGASFATLEPRLSVDKRFSDEVTARLAFGLAHQAPTWLVPVPALDTAGLQYGLQEAVRGELGVTYTPSRQHAFTLRAWGLGLTKSLELSPLDGDFLMSVKGAPQALSRHTGGGWAAGGELSWRLAHHPTWSAFAGYSFQQTVRETSFSRYGDDGTPIAETRGWLPTSFQQAHVLSALAELRPWSGWSFSLGASVRSGPPEAGQFFSTAQRQGIDPVTQGPRWVPEDRDRAGTVGPWLRVDARASKTWRPGNVALTLFLDVQNLSFFRQPTGTSYTTAPASPSEQATGRVTLQQRGATSPLPGPLPMLGLDLRY